MSLQLIGAIFVIVSCGGIGFSIAASHKQAERTLQQLIYALDRMYHELQFHLTPLPQLVSMAAEGPKDPLRSIFLSLSEELSVQTHPDANTCMKTVLNSIPQLPVPLYKALSQLGSSLGRFDLSGQLSGLESVKQLCQRDLDGLMANRDIRLRSYRTLGVCAGVALVILFI